MTQIYAALLLILSGLAVVYGRLQIYAAFGRQEVIVGVAVLVVGFVGIFASVILLSIAGTGS